MRLAHALELTAAISIGFGLIRFRATGPDYRELCPTFVDRLIDGTDVFFAGAAVVVGASVAVERARGTTHRAWGIGRWIWFASFAYVLLRVAERASDTLSHRRTAIHVDNSWLSDVIVGFRGKYSGFLLPSFAWMLLAFLICWLTAPSKAIDNARDALETSGRVFAALVILTLLAMKVLLFLGYNQGGMGGGLAEG
jgi:hypothetical protein